MASVHESFVTRWRALALTTDELASLSGVEAARIEAIGRGEAMTVWELTALANALALDPAALHRGESDDPRWSVARFRTAEHGETLVPYDVRTIARATEAGRVHHFLRARCGHPRAQASALRDVKALSATTEPWQQGYDLGKHARERLHPAHAALPSVQGLLERAGVLVLDLQLQTKAVEAVSLVEPDASPVIVVNRAAPRTRSRASRRAMLAHELCHVLHDATGKRDLATVLSRRDDPSPVEQRANAFAPAFLAPPHWVQRTRGRVEQQVVTLAKTWGLSFEGAAWHAKNLKLLSPTTAEAIIARRPHPPVDLRDFEPPLGRLDPAAYGLDVKVSDFARSALGDQTLRALACGVISSGRAVEILSFR